MVVSPPVLPVAAQAESLKRSLEDVWQHLTDLDEQVQNLREEQERADQEKAKQVEKERKSAAGRAMMALGIDLGDSKHNPGCPGREFEKKKSKGLKDRTSNRNFCHGVLVFVDRGSIHGQRLARMNCMRQLHDKLLTASCGVHLAGAALTTLSSTPPASHLEPGIKVAASTLQKMAKDPQGAAQV
eukprot:scaffold45898_cov18-Tisochrysis_lutea.AAC.1